ncbi:hypothetical protein B0H13DRAFT_2019412 [Mycena leptocephala]|nr:hypothetical protein B0H13DRAFT_2019412 [Mycena leptocephala]
MTPRETAEYLRTLPAIRDRCNRVFELATQDKLQYFEYHPENEPAVTEFCIDIIQKTYGTEYEKIIPPHGRWRHSDAHQPRIAPLLEQWASSPSHLRKRKSPRDSSTTSRSPCSSTPARAQVGCTPSPNRGQFRRSEGLGVAAVHMFTAGLFSGDKEQPYRVDGVTGLASLTPAALASAFQVTPETTCLLTRLADALRASAQFFGPDARPGGLVAYLKTQSTSSPDGQTEVPMAALWHALITGLQPIWPPGRASLGGVPLGDVWAYKEEGSDLVPFHKLTGWLAYSLREPLERVLDELQTGLPEYRNGGLFLDLDVLRLRPTHSLSPAWGEVIQPEEIPKDATTGIPRVPPSHPAIVEWRAMTVVLLGTWTGGRVIAAQLRPGKDGKEGGGPPIEIVSDGTVF